MQATWLVILMGPHLYKLMHGAGHGAYKQACWGKNDGLQHPYKVGLMQTDRGSWCKFFHVTRLKLHNYKVGLIQTDGGSEVVHL